MIILIPIGDVDTAIINYLQDAIIKELHTRVVVESRIDVPRVAYNAERNQYLATIVLDSLTKYTKPDAKLLGVTNVDLYVPNLNFVFGIASGIPGNRCVISLHRLYPRFYGEKHDEELFKLRVLKEAIHELGHLYGLMHCPNPKCVMHFSNSILDTDYKSYRFCKRCLTKLRGKIFKPHLEDK